VLAVVDDFDDRSRFVEMDREIVDGRICNRWEGGEVPRALN
jgi:hypothetical protein